MLNQQLIIGPFAERYLKMKCPVVPSCTHPLYREDRGTGFAIVAHSLKRLAYAFNRNCRGPLGPSIHFQATSMRTGKTGLHN
ncbi:hypothetical protein TNCT_493271 [Trichonephila clavata]|uniref:Uncharacterized protein n=1 Tax=Trichonephila clavata TaxID=2740835 RepID=A0A8X6GGJ4_TRICU|nr:hypothetical protein TNCT_493271 [Trichonephila clavata]